MKELLYTILELEEWHSSNSACDFCPGLKIKTVCQIRTQSKATGEMIKSDKSCESCREKFENDELPKCSCGRLKTRYACDCKEEGEEKELPLLPHQNGEMSYFYERQINSLQEQLNTAEWTIQYQEEREAHEDFMEKSEEWGKRQKQELLDRIKKLEAENKRVKNLTSQKLIDELNSCKEKIKLLEEQNGQLIVQVEVKEPKKWSWLKVKK